MHTAYSLTQLLKLPLTIESIKAFGDNLLVGTKQGHCPRLQKQLKTQKCRRAIFVYINVNVFENRWYFRVIPLRGVQTYFPNFPWTKIFVLSLSSWDSNFKKIWKIGRFFTLVYKMKTELHDFFARNLLPS